MNKPSKKPVKHATAPSPNPGTPSVAEVAKPAEKRKAAKERPRTAEDRRNAAILRRLDEGDTPDEARQAVPPVAKTTRALESPHRACCYSPKEIAELFSAPLSDVEAWFKSEDGRAYGAHRLEDEWLISKGALEYGWPPPERWLTPAFPMNALEHLYNVGVHLIQALHRIAPGIDTTAKGMVPQILKDWYKGFDAAYEAAKTSNLRADLLSIHSLIGNPIGAPARLRAEASTPTSWFLGEFERLLAAIRRHVAMERVTKRPKNPAPIALPPTTVDRACKFIDDNSGATGEEVSSAAGCHHGYFRRDISPKLKDRGYTNDGQHGWQPPSKRPV